MSKIKKFLVFLLLFSVAIFTNSCSDNSNKKEGNKKEIAKFQPIDLLDRDKNLSYDEFIKIKEKYNKLKNQYLSDNSNYESLLKLVEIYVYEARVTGEHPYYYQAALKTLEEILKNENKLTKDQNFTALFYKSTVQLSQHNFNEALVTGKAAMKINNLNSGIFGVLVDANVEIGNYEEAVKMCDQMLQIRPDLRSYSRTSYLREIYGDIKGSKEIMVQAINAGAPYSEYKCWSIITLGQIFEDHGQLDSANSCYEMALTERENYPFAIAGKARVQAKKENYDEATFLFNEAINITPEIGFNIDLASLKIKEGKTEEANKMIKEIEVMFKEDIESGHNMNLEYAAFVMSFKKDFKTALNYGLKELEKRPKNIDVNKLLSFVYFGLKDNTNTKKHLKIALATNKKDADLICLNGLVNEDRNEIKKSFEMNPFQDHIFAEDAKMKINKM